MWSLSNLKIVCTAHYNIFLQHIKCIYEENKIGGWIESVACTQTREREKKNRRQIQQINKLMFLPSIYKHYLRIIAFILSKDSLMSTKLYQSARVCVFVYVINRYFHALSSHVEAFKVNSKPEQSDCFGRLLSTITSQLKPKHHMHNMYVVAIGKAIVYD